jgi:hypothetical protein
MGGFMNSIKLLIFLSSLGAFSSFGTSKKLQICASKCETQFCKKLAEEVEFEFELLSDYLLPPCRSASAKLAQKELRLVFLDHKDEGQVEVELDCLGHQTCMSQNYDEAMRGAALTAKVVSDVRVAIKHMKPVTQAESETPKEALEPVAQAPVVKEEWDHIVVPLAKEIKAQSVASQPLQIETPQVVQSERANFNASATLSFGGENWNYAFDSDATSERVGSVHSRIYPRMTLAASFWPTSFMRVSTMVGASVASLRIKANQPVDGDGRIVLGQMYQGTLVVGVFKSLGDLIRIGIDAGYDFQGAFIDKQRVSDRTVTIAPSFQSHGLRLGPRLLIAALSDKGMIDIGAGFYPYHHYEESPDEPTSAKSLFSWSLHGVARLMLSTDMYADATLRAQIFHVHYTDGALRENAEGDKWGPGQVTNASTSAMVGLGWLF